jgi:hypothetical protein
MKRYLIVGLVLIFGSCRQETEPPGPVLVTLESSTTTAARGDTISFTVNATGNTLVGVVVDFGDQVTEQYATGGARTARVTFKHAFQTAGSFTVNAVVTDAVAGEKEASASVVIN